MMESSDFGCVSNPLAFTQHLRGQVYILGDCILSYQKPFPEKDISVYVDFFHAYIRMFNKFINVLPKLLPIYVESQNVNKNAFLVNTKVAIASAFPELFQLLTAIFGGEVRCTKFFKNNRLDTTDPSNITDSKVASSPLLRPTIVDENNKMMPESGNRQIFSFMNYFATLGGFESLNELLSWEEKIGSEVYQIPIALLKSIILLFNRCISSFTPENANIYRKVIYTKTIERIQRITDKEIKDINVCLVQDTISAFVEMMSRCSSSEDIMHVHEKAEKLEVAFIIKLIRSSNLEKKIIGINSIKEVFTRVREEVVSKVFASKNNAEIRKFEYFTRVKLLSFLVKEVNLLEIILVESFHPEILKRSLDVLQFFSDENELSEKHIEMIWNLTENKHETDLASIYSLITQLASILSVNALEQLYGFINSIPFDSYTDLTVSLLKDFTLNATETLALANRRTTSQNFITGSRMTSNLTATSRVYPGFGVARLFAATEEHANITSQSVISKSIDALSEIFKSNYFISQKEVYIQKCFTNIKGRTSVCTSLKLLCMIQRNQPNLCIFNESIQMNSQSEGQQQQQQLSNSAIKMSSLILNKGGASTISSGSLAGTPAPTNSSILFDAVITDFEGYIKSVKSKVKKNNTSSSPTAIIDVKKDEVLFGQHTHQDNVEIRLEFIALMNKHLLMKRQGITIEHLKSLWKILVRSPVSHLEKNVFLSWLMKRKPTNMSEKVISTASSSGFAQQPVLLEDGTLATILEQIFGNGELMNGFQVDKETFDCVKNIFLSVNTKNKSIEISPNQQHVYIVKFDGIIAKNIFWEMSLVPQADPAIFEVLSQILVSLHVRKMQRSLDFRIKIWQNFQLQCLENLSKSKHPAVQAHIVSSIKAFLEEIEGKSKIGDKFHEMTIKFGKKNIKLPSNSTLLRLRKEITAEFKFGKRDFSMLYVNTNVTISKDQEEEYSIEALATNDNTLPTITISNVKETSQDLLDIEQFKMSLSNSQFSKILLDFLSTNASSNIVENAWEILSLLPKNPSLVNQLSNPGELKPDQFNELLPLSCFSKLQYCFQTICQEFLPRSEEKFKKEQEQWCLSFISAGGLKHLLKLFISLKSEEDFSKPFNLFCISTLAEILSKFVKNFFASHSKEFTHGSTSGVNLLAVLAEKSLFLINAGIIKSNSFISNVKADIAANRSDEASMMLVRKYLIYYFKYNFELIKACFMQDSALKVDFLHKKEKYSSASSIASVTTTGSTSTSSSSASHFTNILLGLLRMNDMSPRNQLQLSLISLIQFDETGIAALVFEERFATIIANECATILAEHRATSNEFFLLYKKVLMSILKLNLVNTWTSFQKTLSILIDIIQNCEPFEHDKTEQDGLLKGVFLAAQQLMVMHPSLGAMVASNHTLAKTVIEDCLFSIATSEQPLLPKCKNNQTRASAFLFLVSLQQAILMNGGDTIVAAAASTKTGTEMSTPMDGSSDSQVGINNKLMNLYCSQNAHWRTKSKSDWNIKEEIEKDQTCPIGLVNLGCTCYMNSLLQQLFTIQEFSSSICKVDAEASEKEFDPVENVLHQLQQVFSALSESKRQVYNPRGFCGAIKNEFGEPMNVMQQMDVDEFFNTLMDRLENLLKPTKNEFLVKSVFEGNLANELIGMGGGCTHTSEREETFNSVSLTVQNKSSLAESLQNFVQGEMLDGDNSYFCEKCDKKVPTLKRQSLKKLPNQLIVVLKRFQFDLDTMQKHKVDTYCEFPHELNLKPYSQEHLKAQDKQSQQSEQKDAQSLQDASSNQIDSQSTTTTSSQSTTTAQDTAESTQSTGEETTGGTSSSTSAAATRKDKEIPQEYYNYRLRGVVIHQGTTDSGHYYSLIRQADDKWMEFNDHSISPFDIKNLASEAFGGDHTDLPADLKGNLMNNSNKSANISKLLQNNKNAYLLFYEREQYFDADANPIQTLLNQNNIVNPTTPSKEHIAEELRRLHWNKFLFSNDMSEYAMNLLNMVDEQTKGNTTTTTPAGSNNLSTETAKFLVSHFFTISIRLSEKTNLPAYRNKLGSIISHDANLAKWIVKHVADQSFLREIFHDCPQDESKYLVAGIICDAISKISEKEQHLTSYDTSFEKGDLARLLAFCLILTLNSTLSEFKIQDQLHRLISHSAKVSRSARVFLLREKGLGVLRSIFTESRVSSQFLIEKFRPESFQSRFTCVDSMLPTKTAQQASSIDEFLEIREKMKRISGIRKNSTNLMHAFSILLRSVSGSSTPTHESTVDLSSSTTTSTSEAVTPFLLDRIDYTPTTGELEAFAVEFPRVWMFCQKRLAKKHLALSLACLTIDNSNYFDAITNTFVKFIHQDTKIDDIDLKAYFLFFKYSLQIKDSLTSKRVGLIAQRIASLFFTVQKNFYAASLTFDAIISLSIVSRGFKNEMQKQIQQNKEYLKSLEQFLQCQTVLFNALGTKNMSLYREKIVQVNLKKISQISEQINAKFTYRRKCIENVATKGSESLTPLSYDSDEDIPAERKIQANEKTFIVIDGDVSKHLVVEATSDLLKLQDLEDKSKLRWVKYDEDQLRLYPEAIASYPNHLAQLHL